MVLERDLKASKGGDIVLKTFLHGIVKLVPGRFVIVGLVISVSLLMLVQSALAGNKGGTRPGWGFGDTNHVHTGPPGHSVHPHISQSNNANVSNNIVLSANTGGNSTGGGGSIVTGAVSFVVSVANNVNQNVFSGL